MTDNTLTEAQLLFRLQQFHGAELEATEMGDHEFAHECADVASIIREVQAYRKAADKPASIALKDHQIRELVNELRDIAEVYHANPQLRERIAHVIRAALPNGAKS
ncbi:TPA: hypothetical protein QCI16_004478 [Enterobacter ludwigii]|nr:hypothetical protein [Enterobacter ludwigii]HDR2600256.1 hypothetical protein [Enterobacter ludwigii]